MPALKRDRIRYIYIYIHVYVCMFVYTYKHTYIHTHYTHTRTHTYIRIDIYTHTHTLGNPVSLLSGLCPTTPGSCSRCGTSAFPRPPKQPRHPKHEGTAFLEQYTGLLLRNLSYVSRNFLLLCCIYPYYHGSNEAPNSDLVRDDEGAFPYSSPLLSPREAYLVSWKPLGGY